MQDRSYEISIRAAERAEMRACRMLLPAAFKPDQAPVALVACDPDGALIGAAAIDWAATGDPPAFKIIVHVLPHRRRQGVGRSLIEAVVKIVRGEALAVQAWTALTEGSAAAMFCLACGFTAHHRTLHFIADAPVLEATLAVYRAKLDRAGWIPASARVVPLKQAPAADVAHLLAREFHVSAAAMLARLRGEIGKPFDAERSVVLLLDNAVAGAQMASLSDDGMMVAEANVVAPTLRRGWANLLLTHEGTRISAGLGTRRFRFFCDDRVIDTVNLARRCGAERDRVDLVVLREAAPG